MTNSVTMASIESLVQSRPDVDNSSAYAALWNVLGEFFAKIRARLPVHSDPVPDVCTNYTSPDGEWKGSLNTYSSPEVDWLVHSWAGNPKKSFTNAHLNVWLGPDTDVPHIGIVFGTLPDLFMYIDYVPRRDPMVNRDYLLKYFGPLNDEYMAHYKRADIKRFVSEDVYMRVAMSPTAFCYTAKPTAARIEEYRKLGHLAIDRWIGWLDEATPVAHKDRAALAHRDYLYRTTVVQTDPANEFAYKLFGKELADRLLHRMWGGDRTSVRTGR